MLEFLFGNKNAEMVAVHQRDALAHETLQRALAAPSLYDEVLRLLSRRGYGIPQDYLSRISASPTGPATGGRRLARRVPQRSNGLGPVRTRRAPGGPRPQFPVVALPSPENRGGIIGYKPGTGGTGGVSYLAKALELKFFPELWQIRTSM